MIIGLLSFLFGLVCVLIILLVLIQKGKSSLGIGNLGGSQQMLFGGSGGQDIFQKTTWVLGAILILGSLGLATTKARKAYQAPRYTQQLPVAPAEQQAE